MNTKEQAFLSVFRALQTRENNDPAWLLSLREKAADSFATLDFPTTRDEAWKYTNIAPALKPAYRNATTTDVTGVTDQQLRLLTFAETRHSRLVFINGLYAAALSDTSALPGQIITGNLADAPATAGAKQLRDHLAAYADHRGDVFTALNTASLGDGAFVCIPAGQVIETPIHLHFIATATDGPVMAHPRALIVAEPGAMATIIESYVSLSDDIYFTNAVTEIVTGAGASIRHFRLQDESEKAFHVGATQVAQERDSSYTACAISIGAAIARHNLNVTLN
ncbi:MAG: SufD family Fe-S cluster assembly protein, partial [Blastocatellia bacterium]